MNKKWNKKRAGVFIVILILGIFGFATFVSTKTLGVAFKSKRASPARADVSSLVDEGKIALYNHDVLTAKAKFLQAVTGDPANQEAQMLYGVTRIIAVYEEGQGNHTPGLDSIREIAELAGFTFSEYGVYSTVVQNNPDKLAVTTPKTGDMFNFLNTKVLAEINGAVDNLNRVTSTGFVSVMDPAALKTTGPAYNIDYADVLLIKASLYAAKASLEVLLAYNLDVYVPQILYGLDAEKDGLVALRNLIVYYPQFLTPKEPSRLSSSKAAAINGIDTYVSAIGLVKARTTSTNHLFVLDVPLDHMTNEPVHSTTAQQDSILKTLADVRASLNGVREWKDTFPDKPKEQRTFDLSKFFDPSAPLNFRQMFLAGDSSFFVSDNTVKGIVPYGLAQFVDFSAPSISQSQKGCFFGQSVVLSGSGFSPQNTAVLTVLNPDGTTAVTKTVNTDKIGQFNYVFTVPSKEGAYKWRAKDTKTGVQTDYLTLPVTQYRKVWESGSTGMGAGQFFGPNGIAAQGTEVFVADSLNNRVQVLDNAGNYKRMWDDYGDGNYFSYPLGISAGPSAIFVADSYNGSVGKFTTTGTYQDGIFGEFSYPTGVAANATGDLYVLDQGYATVQKFDSSLNPVTSWGGWGSSDGYFDLPTGIAVDSKSNVYVSDADGRIQKFDKNGAFNKAWSMNYMYPAAISMDAGDNIFVSTGDRRIVKFKPDGTYVTEWRSYDSNNNKQTIWGLAADGSNNVYGTTDSNSVVKFSPVSWYTLKATKTGTGSGTVVSVPLGINCGTYCTNPFASETVVAMRAIPDSGASAVGWTNCDQVVNDECLVKMTTGKTVSVEFSSSPKLTWTVTPSVTPSDLSGGTITPSTPQKVNDGSVAKFTLSPKPGYIVGSVGGTCGGTLSGTKYTTSAVIAGCTVNAVFSLKPPAITSLSPATGTIGTTVTIKGKYFTGTQGTVTFNDKTATVSSWTDTLITCVVPGGLTAGSVQVTVTNAAGSSPTKAFSLKPPAITSLSPATGTIGTTVTIKGKYFTGTQGTVTFNDKTATVSSWTDTLITCVVPGGLTAGSVQVTVTNAAGSSPTKAFSLKPPAITSLSPATGTIGTTVTIKGKYFTGTQGTVTFNDKTATVSSWTDTLITCVVPGGLTAGSVQVTVTNAAGSSPTKAFSLKPPAITSLSPATGTIGTTVTIKGKYFTGTQGTVTFNDKTATVSSWTDTLITCVVPGGLTAGSVQVTVTNAAGSSTGKKFTVKP